MNNKFYDFLNLLKNELNTIYHPSTFKYFSIMLPEENV